jgi:predicted RND superfamily exporter protein
MNVANLLFLPLVMGIGIDNGIYIVHCFWTGRGMAEPPVPLARGTGKAVTLSSLTTLVGFGSLMISNQRGIHSLGLLVALGVGSVLLASLTVLPSLLAVLAARARNRAGWMMDHEDLAVDKVFTR